jgi:glycerol-3-phosphate dehydrogenase
MPDGRFGTALADVTARAGIENVACWMRIAASEAAIRTL